MSNKFQVNLSRYKRGKFIGKGAYGVVYTCTHKKTGKKYAAKVSIIGIKNAEHVFQRELETLLHIDHPCVIKLFGYSLTDFNDDESPVILTEYMETGSLKNAINAEFANKPISNWDNTRKQIIFIGMVAGLKALHEKNIIHRDFKPDNILLDENLNPHIIDFGLSKILDPDSTVNMSMYGGTASYMAPEILEGSDFTYPVDMYALGISIYELICGHSAYDEKQQKIGKILKNVTSGIRPKFNHKCPEAFQEFISNLWSQSPSKRMTSEKALEEVMNNEDLILPSVNVSEVRSYCMDVLDEVPKSVKTTQRRKTIHVPKPKKTSMLSKTTKPAPAETETVSKVTIKVPKKKTIRKFQEKDDKETEKKAEKGTEKKEEKGTEKKTKSTKPKVVKEDDDDEEPKISSSHSIDRYSKSMNPSLLKRFSDSSFMSSINETMKTTLLKEDSDALTSTINATKNDDFSLSTSISAKIADLSKIKLLQTPDPSMPAELLFMIGVIYENGYHGKGMNFTRSAAFYKAAADKGHASAMFNYGNFLRDGVGVDENPEEAVKYLKKAANAGCVEATVNLGRMIEEGEGCESDIKEALKWYEKGAEAGQTLGYFNAGRLCLIGDEKSGLEPNPEKAEKYLKKAVDQDDSGVGPKILLAVHYFMTDQYDKGIPYAKSAADEDIPPAQFIYAIMIMEKKPKEAADYLERAANGGFKKALFVLGNMYYRGDGVKKSYEKAAEWFRASAESGDSDGALRYGMCLVEGEGVEEDADEGARYIREACEAGNNRAPVVLVTLGLIEKKFTLNDDDEVYVLKGFLLISALM